MEPLRNTASNYQNNTSKSKVYAIPEIVSKGLENNGYQFHRIAEEPRKPSPLPNGFLDAIQKKKNGNGLSHNLSHTRDTREEAGNPARLSSKRSRRSLASHPKLLTSTTSFSESSLTFKTCTSIDICEESPAFLQSNHVPETPCQRTPIFNRTDVFSAAMNFSPLSPFSFASSRFSSSSTHTTHTQHNSPCPSFLSSPLIGKPASSCKSPVTTPFRFRPEGLDTVSPHTPHSAIDSSDESSLSLLVSVL